MALGYKLFQAMLKDGLQISLPCLYHSSTRGSGCLPGGTRCPCPVPGPCTACAPRGRSGCGAPWLSPTPGRVAHPGQHRKASEVLDSTCVWENCSPESKTSPGWVPVNDPPALMCCWCRKQRGRIGNVGLRKITPLHPYGDRRWIRKSDRSWARRGKEAS